LGNIEAMRTQQRFIGTNLNRLFGAEREYTSFMVDSSLAGLEQQRAKMLQLAVGCFQARHPAQLMIHLDLHTAIGRSEIDRFALLPPSTRDASTAPESDLLRSRLQAAGMEGCVRHQASGSTFSAWT